MAKKRVWKKVDCQIKDQDGKMFFAQTKVEAPEAWSQLAIEIAASKYFRKIGVPKTGRENSIRQMVARVALRAGAAGLEQKHFASKVEAAKFTTELEELMLDQKGLFNSPVWFNYGLSQAYRIRGEGRCWHWNSRTRKIEELNEVYKHPQVSACFIQRVDDSLESIFNLVQNEARLFKFGSGSGTNFSAIRGRDEPLGSGGSSSGLLSFLEILDRSAGSVKSGGTSRRAAKMVILDIDHPEIEDFIQWKAREEKKAAVLAAAGYGTDYESESYRTVSGQNANNSVRVTDAFLKAAQLKKPWPLKARTTGKVIRKIPAADLWRQIAEAAWQCADPGVQFHDTINDWHTCPESGEIRGSNPCSEFMFLEDTSCNLASLNLLKFLLPDGSFDLTGYRRAIHIFFTAQEIFVDDASYPTATIALNSHLYRPLGLGIAGLGAFLMQKGIAYDSDLGRSWGAVLVAILTGVAYECSAQMASRQGAFVGYRKNKTAMLKVIAKHRKAALKIDGVGLPTELKDEVVRAWTQALKLGKIHGYRNSQATVLAPTGTIGLVMDSETTGIEPEFSLLKRKKLSGGGQLRILSQAFVIALQKLGYSSELIQEIQLYVDLNGSLAQCSLIQSHHLDVFATAMEISPTGHLKMMAALQPFVSGAISKTVNMPHSSSVDDVAVIYQRAWELGLKAVAIYRDGSKGSQPLEAMGQKSEKDQTDPNLGKPVSQLISEASSATTRWTGLSDQKLFENEFPKCFECGTRTELAGTCFRCPNCGSVIGCG